MIKSVSLHLSNPAEWWWILFGVGLRVLKKVKVWQTRPGMYVLMTAWHVVWEYMYVCDWPIQLAGRNAAPPAHGWAAVWETPVSHMPSTDTYKVHWKSAPILVVMALQYLSRSASPTHITMDNGRGQGPLSGGGCNGYGWGHAWTLWETAHHSKPTLHNHPCRSVCLHQSLQQQAHFHPNTTV